MLKPDFCTPSWKAVTEELDQKSTSSLIKSGNIVTPNPPRAEWQMYQPPVLLHIMPSVKLQATTLSVLCFLFIHKISAAITLLN